MSSLQYLPLHESHLSLKAKMHPFAGFLMPMSYSSIAHEVKSVREKTGIFDVSHMGEFLVEGSHALSFLNALVTNYIPDHVGKATYSPLCRENGTVVDDLIIYHLASHCFLLCVNASNIEKDWNHVWQQYQRMQKDYPDLILKNVSSEYSLLAIQGPMALQQLKDLGLWPSKQAYASYEVMKCPRVDSGWLATTGYTGEEGVEIFCEAKEAKKIWDQCIEANIVPCGLGARDVLRIEKGFPLYGHEISDEVTPLDSNLKWTVKFEKPFFVGRSALMSKEPRFRQIRFRLEKGIPREGYTIVNDQKEVVGKVTSGTFSPIFNQGIGMAQLERTTPSDGRYYLAMRDQLFELLPWTKTK